jgi:hypothetical protein
MKLRISTLVLAFALPIMANADDSRFAIVCEWQSNGVGGSQTFHVDIQAKTVDGKKAVINDNVIYFVKNAVEYTIDRSSGVLEFNDLKPSPGIRLAGPIHRCKKITERRF